MKINAKNPQLQWTSFFFGVVFGRYCIFSNIVRPQLINICNLLIHSCSDFVLVNVAKDLSICNTNVATHHRCRLSFSREFGELPSHYFKSALAAAYLGLLIRKTYLFWEEALGWLSLIGMYHFNLKSACCCGRFGCISFVALFAWSGRHPFLIRWPDTIRFAWVALCLWEKIIFFLLCRFNKQWAILFRKALQQVLQASESFCKLLTFCQVSLKRLIFFIFSRNKVATPVAVLC